MIEIKFTLDASTALIVALKDLAGAILAAVHSITPLPSGYPCGQLTPPFRTAELREGIEKDGAAEKAQNLTDEATVESERTGTTESTEAAKKRKPRAKKAPSDSADQVPHSSGDDLSPDGGAVPERAATEKTTATEPAPVEEAPAAPAEGPLAGKGQTGEILADLTRKAIADLDALGVDRCDANRRIRDYCARNEIKFPTFPALLHAVGYDEALAICKGA